MRVGLVHFMAFPATIKGEGPVLETIRKIAVDDYFSAIEITTIKDPEQRMAVKKMLETSHMTIAYGAQPRLLTTGLNINHLVEEERQKALQNLMAGIGRSNLGDLKNVDAYFKYRILRQVKGNKMPLTAMVFYGIENKIGPVYNQLEYTNRLTHTAQLIIGKKVSDGFSFQLSPTVVWGNMFGVTYSNIALGIGMRQKLTKRTTMNLEYIPVLTNYDYIQNSLSVGFDIETGGHVFQIHFTNSKGLNEAQFIANTRETWDTYGIRFGFNLSRVFTIVKPKN